jgi:hypothetical protein
MAQVIMDHPGSGCFGTSLAPTSPTSSLFPIARATLSTWFNVLNVRQFGTMPFRLSVCAQGLIRIAPVIIRVPDRFRRRFRPFTFQSKHDFIRDRMVVHAILLSWLKAVHVQWSVSIYQIRSRTKVLSENVFRLSNAFHRMPVERG